MPSFARLCTGPQVLDLGTFGILGATMLSLQQAIAQKRLAEFIEQQEAAGQPVPTQAEFDAALKSVITLHQSEDRTSGSRARGGSTGK